MLVKPSGYWPIYLWTKYYFSEVSLDISPSLVQSEINLIYCHDVLKLNYMWKPVNENLISINIALAQVKFIIIKFIIIILKHFFSFPLIFSNYWMTLSRIWRIRQIKEGVIQRPKAEVDNTLRILHILRKPNSITAFYSFKIFPRS